MIAKQFYEMTSGSPIGGSDSPPVGYQNNSVCTGLRQVKLRR